MPVLHAASHCLKVELLLSQGCGVLWHCLWAAGYATNLDMTILQLPAAVRIVIKHPVTLYVTNS